MFNLPNRFDNDVVFDTQEFTWEANIHGEYTDLSCNVSNVLGYKHDELIGKTPFMFMPQHHRVKNQRIFKLFQKRPRSFNAFPSKRIHKDGTIIYLESSVAPQYENKKLIGYKGISRDITQKIKYQKAVDNTYKQLKKINKYLKNKIDKEVRKNKEKDAKLFAQSKLAAMGDMIGNISHQWRQPLNVISTTASAVKIEHELEQLDPELIPKYMGIIMEQTEYLSKTIDTFMNFINEKKEFQKTNLTKVIHDTIKIVEMALKNNHITIDIPQDEQLFETYTIASELQEVLINLISNAKDAIILNKINQGHIKIELYKNNAFYTITVEDNGGGIDSKIISRIFEPYFTTKHQYQGTGLGLHMSYRIIKHRLNGDIYVKNGINGAKFFMHIPIIEKEHLN